MTSTDKHVVVWSSWSYGDDPSAKPWPAAICRSCSQSVRVIGQELAIHLYPSGICDGCSDSLCPGSGELAGNQTVERRGESWCLMVRETGVELGRFRSKEEADYKKRIVDSSNKSDGRVNRYDRAPLAHVTRTQEGFLKIDGSKIARTGIQEYRRADGRVVKEFRDPREVFNADSLKSYALQPLTNQHPSKMLDTADAKKHAVGAVGEAKKLDEKWVTAPISVWDAEAIKSIEDGRVELSAGYSCEVIDEPGEYDGKKYDCRQANIVVNHLALVDFARAGSEARLRLDSGDGEAIFDSPISHRHTEINSARKPMAQLKIDGMVFEVSDANIQAVVDNKIAAVKKDGDEKTATEKARADAAERDRAAAQAKADALEAKIKADEDRMVKCDECGGKGECKNCEGKGEYPAKMDTADRRAASLARMVDKRVDARATLRQLAAKVLGANVKLDGKADAEIKKLVVGKALPTFKLDGRNDDEINAAFDIATADAAKVAPIDSARPALVTAPKADDKPTDPEEAKRRYDERYLSANVKAKK